MLAAELDRRKRRNRRYSLRSFATSLGVHNSSLSRLMNGGHRLTPRAAQAIGAKLGLSKAEIAAAVAHEHSEVLLSLVGHPDFRADSRWLAVMSGLPVDDVNVAIHSLLHARRLTMTSAARWRQEKN